MTPAQTTALAVAMDGLEQAGFDAATLARMKRAVEPGTMVADHAETLTAAAVFLRERLDMEGTHYGSFMGGDPRDFRPDSEAATPEEMERHRAACLAAEHGESGSDSLEADQHFRPGFGFVTSHQFGPGTTTIHDDEGLAVVVRLEALLSPAEAPPGASTPQPPGETP